MATLTMSALGGKADISLIRAQCPANDPKADIIFV